jgi:site-specific DNA-methyltransferase (adenine-specific)
MSNRLYYGDNLNILREHVAVESVDLIYLDPPKKAKTESKKTEQKGLF